MSKIGSAASEEKSFENVNGRTHGRTDDGRKVITIPHPEQSSGELKRTRNKRDSRRKKTEEELKMARQERIFKKGSNKKGSNKKKKKKKIK